MSILLKLSARHLRLNRRRTAITIIGIALSIAMVTAISGFIVSFQDMLYNDAVLRDGLWHVRYFGLSEETAARVTAEPVFASYTLSRAEDGVSIKLLFKQVDRHLFDRSEEVCKRLGIGKEQVQYQNNLLIAKGVIPAGYYESLYAFAAILLALVAIASVMVIGNAFSISAAERSRQFGLLKSVGATAKQVRGAVLWEGVILGLCAIPLGILGGLAAEWVALAAANHILSGMEAVNFLARFRVVISPWVLLAAVVAAFLTIFLAAWLPARRAARLSAIDAIRQTASIRVCPRDVRVSPLSRVLFGFPGLLAAKTMKRSRGRYRTTVISLVVSIVLLIAVSSFGQMLFKASAMVYEDYGSNVLVTLPGDDPSRLGERILALPNAETHPFRGIQGTAEIPPGWMTANGLEMLGAGEKNVFLYSLSDTDYTALCAALRIDPAALADDDRPGGILINTSGTYIRQGRRHNFTPYRSLNGQSVTVALGGGTQTLTIRGETDSIPIAVAIAYAANGMSLVVPESLRKAWQPEDQQQMLAITVMAADPDAFAEQAKALLAAGFPESDYRVTNYEALVENNRNIWTLIMIFVYGFIAMLSLISVTNVITTISTGLALRRRELTMLRSIGMTQRDIGRSLRFESLIYGGKALLIGIPLGIVASLAMYRALDGSMSFEYIWPVQGITVSIAAVLILTLATMRFSSRRLRKEDIAGVLQNEIT